jgi:hypothetical protein
MRMACQFPLGSTDVANKPRTNYDAVLYNSDKDDYDGQLLGRLPSRVCPRRCVRSRLSAPILAVKAKLNHTFVNGDTDIELVTARLELQGE